MNCLVLNFLKKMSWFSFKKPQQKLFKISEDSKDIDSAEENDDGFHFSFAIFIKSYNSLDMEFVKTLWDRGRTDSTTLMIGKFPP